MSHTVWRIATDTPDYEANDLSGEGAKRTGGRWNQKGVPMIYSSATRALACLETIVHLNAGGLPPNRYLVAVTIPDELWINARQESASSLPVGWDAEPPGPASIKFGTDWIRSGNAAALVLPSVFIPEETQHTHQSAASRQFRNHCRQGAQEALRSTPDEDHLTSTVISAKSERSI